MSPVADPLPWLLSAAFWLALLRHPSPGRRRLVLGLVLGAAAARAGWLLLHADRLTAADALLADPRSGLCVLFVPLGPLLAATTERDPKVRRRLRASACRVLPLALATARLGCWLAGCCGGRSVGALPAWLAPQLVGVASRHPAPLYEIVGLLALHALLARADDARVFACFALGFGGLRLLVQPFRAPPPLGEPWLAVEILAVAWCAGGALALVGASVRSRRAARAALPSAP